MYLALKKAHGVFNLSRAIDLFSGAGGYCHSELIFTLGMYKGVSFSSTTLDKDVPSGVRFRKIRYSHADEWSFFQIPMSDADEAEALEFAKSVEGADYDKPGVMRYLCPQIEQKQSAWYCSEVCVAALQAAHKLLDYIAWKVSPNKLAKIARKRGWLEVAYPLVVSQASYFWEPNK